MVADDLTAEQIGYVLDGRGEECGGLSLAETEAWHTDTTDDVLLVARLIADVHLALALAAQDVEELADEHLVAQDVVVEGPQVQLDVFDLTLGLLAEDAVEFAIVSGHLGQ